jgi:hypothetical protein
MVTKTILVTIRFNRHYWWKLKGGNIINPFQLVLVTQNNGWFKKIWSLSNHHNFANGDWSFSVLKKGGHATWLWKCSDKNFPKKYDNALLWRLKKFSHHPKNSDHRMVSGNFQLPHLVPFWSPPLWLQKKFNRPFLWRLKLFNRHRRGACHMFLESL